MEKNIFGNSQGNLHENLNKLWVKYGKIFDKKLSIP